MYKEFILILLLGIGLGGLAKRVHISSAAAQVFLGIILGPSVLGLISSETPLWVLGEIGVVILLGVAGVEIGLKRLLDAGWAGLWVAVLGMVFCFAGGLLFARWWGSDYREAIYVGIALTATSIGITVQVLTQFGLIRRRIGEVVIAAAVLDDILAIFLLANAHSILAGDYAALFILRSVGVSILVLGAIFFITRHIGCYAEHWLREKHERFYLLFAVIIILLFATLTEHIGQSFVVGGFFAGVGLGEGLTERERKHISPVLDQVAFMMIPFFFVIIGAKADFSVINNGGMLILMAGLFVIAIFGKVLGAIIGAYDIKRFSDRFLIGVSMAPRGEVGLIIASIGFQQQHISHHVMAALVLTLIAVSLISPLYLSFMSKNISGMESENGA